MPKNKKQIVNIKNIIHRGNDSYPKVVDLGGDMIVGDGSWANRSKKLSLKEKKIIEKSINRTFAEYGDTLKKLAKE